MEKNVMKDIKKSALESLKENAQALLKERIFFLYFAFINSLYLFALSFLINIIYFINFLYKGDNWINSALSAIFEGIYIPVYVIIKFLSIPATFSFNTPYSQLFNDFWFSFLVFITYFIIYLAELFFIFLFNKFTSSTFAFGCYFPCWFFILYSFVHFFDRLAASLSVKFFAALILFIIIMSLWLLLNKHIISSKLKREKKGNWQVGK